MIYKTLKQVWDKVQGVGIRLFTRSSVLRTLKNHILSFRPKGEILVPTKGRDLKDSSHTFGMTDG
jgi:hypothetical protein